MATTRPNRRYGSAGRECRLSICEILQVRLRVQVRPTMGVILWGESPLYLVPVSFPGSHPTRSIAHRKTVRGEGNCGEVTDRGEEACEYAVKLTKRWESDKCDFQLIVVSHILAKTRLAVSRLAISCQARAELALDSVQKPHTRPLLRVSRLLTTKPIRKSGYR